MVRVPQILLTVGLLLCWSQPAAARTAVSTSVKLRVVKLAQQGKRAFVAKKFGEALKHWRKAYTLWPKPQLLYNIALAYERDKKPARALTFLRTFFAEAKSQPQKPALMLGAKKLERTLQPQVSVLHVSGPQGARVFLNDTLAGILPLDVVLLPGSYRLELRASGLTTVKRKILLEAGRNTLLDVKMYPVPRRPRLRLRPRTRPRTRPGPGTGKPPTRPAPAKGLHMAYFLTATGLALALAGTAVGTGVLAVKRFDEFQANKTAENRTRVKTLQNTTNAMWGLAGAAGVAAIVLAIFTRWRSGGESRARPSTQVDIALGSGGLGVAVRGSF